ncbi:selenocysteine lyase/cysteine desulfurase [Ulvibacter antarcticus]|uniref:Selenocysteine lyase/cysteine desulfurase n=2 Tax=Ulvibacter antarcticus TaxID=442714 RepID=A0A3L9YA83_9FLAO|nr:selenocysteine lyase/cysteine desulfurase [Ulvibacter antarcticus]
MTDLKKEFPVLQEYTYLNTASCGLLSKTLTEWRREQDDRLLKGGSVFRDLHKPHIERIRSTVARFFSASEMEIALIPNFSFGFNTLLNGLPKNKKVLLLKTDYPSINWPVENRDFDVCYAEVDTNLEQNIEEAVREHQPDVFAFSIVQYLTGIKIDFDFLKRLKAYHPDLLLIGDGTQFLGTSEFSFSESPLDVVAASTYKWMLSGYGNGLLMIKEDAQRKILPETIGFNSADAIFSKRNDFAYVKHFEPGHQDTLNYGSLEQSILNMENIGMDVISERIASLSTLAKLRFAELDLLDETTLNREQHSNIFSLKGGDAIFQKLKENKIICSQRGKGIRVGFHFYNTEEDLEKLIKVFK